MSDEPAPLDEPDAVDEGNANGLILSMAVPNSYVVGVTIVEGQEPPDPGGTVTPEEPETPPVPDPEPAPDPEPEPDAG